MDQWSELVCCHLLSVIICVFFFKARPTSAGFRVLSLTAVLSELGSGELKGAGFSYQGGNCG